MTSVYQKAVKKYILAGAVAKHIRPIKHQDLKNSHKNELGALIVWCLDEELMAADGYRERKYPLFERGND